MTKVDANLNRIWLFRKGYLQGVFWIILVALTSNLNDILMREAQRLPAQEITFFRYFFATLTLIPIMFFKRKEAFKTTRPWIHVVRSILLFGAISCWAAAVKLVPLSVMSIFALTVPIFVLILARLFLHERVGWQRSIATMIGFAGIFTVIYGNSGNGGLLDSILSVSNGTVFLLFAAILFATSDIINKKYVTKESNLSMLFYIALGTAFFSFAFGYLPNSSAWIIPNTTEFLFLIVLGAGGNLILFFLLRAFAATDVSALAPYRYTELIFAGVFGFLFYQEIPTLWTLIGACIIVTTTASIAYYEIKVKKQT